MSLRVLIAIVSLLTLFTLIACTESEEDKFRAGLLEIYSDNVMSGVNRVMQDKGRHRPSAQDIRDACGVWKDAKYRPNLHNNTQDDWDRVGRAAWAWKQDNSATEDELTRMQYVWSVIYSVTESLEKKHDTFFNGKDFCEFKLKG